MAVTTTQTNKPINPRGNDQSPKGYNRAALYSGKALDFDGVNDLVTTSYTTGFTGAQEFTYCVYINADTNQQSQAIVHGNENVGWGLQSLQVRTETNGIRFFAGTGSSSTSYVDSEAIETNKWYFVVGTHTPTENKIYLNGVLSATATAGSLTNAPQAISIGGYPNYSSLFNGEISSPKIFNTALTAAQVADLYNNPEKVVPTGVDNTALKLWLPMQEGAGTTAYDGSGNGNHGTISGATWTHGIGAPVSQTAVISWNKGTNLLTRSEELENSSWAQSNLTVTSNQIESPNGNDDAEQLTEQAISGVHYVGQSISSASAGTYTFSAFLKQGTQRYGGFRAVTNGFTNRHFVLLDLSDGSVASTNTVGSGITWTYNVVTFSNGWYRLSITGTHSSGNIDISIAPSDSASPTYSLGLPTYLATNKNIYAWGAQVNEGSTAGPYIPTLATAQTSPVLLPQGLTSGRDITGVNLFENVRKQGALNLDGNSWAEVHDNESLDITDAITLEAWVYWDGSSNKGILGRWHNDSNNRNYLLYKASATNLNFYLNAVSPVSYTSLSATKGWTHIVGTYNRTNAVLYVDGVQQASVAHTPAISTGTLPVEIGRNFTSVNQAHTNQIAQPRIYNRALTASEVLQNYNSGKNIYK